MVHAKLNAQAAHILRESGGISLLQWRIIALVRVFGPAVSSTEIIDIIGIDKGLFSRTVKNLVEAGLVRGDTDADDHRRTLLTLSPAGEKIYQGAVPIVRQRQQHLLHNLNDEEFSALKETLDKILVNAERRSF